MIKKYLTFLSANTYQDRMRINYDVNFDNVIVKMLVDHGYDVEGSYEHSYSNDESGVYLLSGGYYAKQYYSCGACSYNWNEMKKILVTLSALQLTPDIKEFIDIDDNSGIIINADFGSTYAEFENNTEIEKLVVSALSNLHNHGYIHGDLHMDNIIVNGKTKQVRFIDLDKCFHFSDSRCNTFIDKEYGTTSFEKACSFELGNINFRV